MPHDHDHDHEHHHHGHDGHDAHDHSNDVEPTLQSLLWSQIEFQKIMTMNESASGSGIKVVEKTWDQRMTTSPNLVSDADEQLLMMIPYELKSFLLAALLTSEAFLERSNYIQFSCAPPSQTQRQKH